MTAARHRERPLVFLVAGEPSGDALGVRLMAALKRRFADGITFMGIGGRKMAGEGLDSLFPMEELSVMGAAELLPHLPRLLRRIRETARAIADARPDAVVTIDAPGFSFRVGERLKGAGIPLVHYVAPQVWAWKPGRARKIAGFLDHLLALLPFEPPLFEAEGLPCTYVGHPVLESGAGSGDARRFRERHGLSDRDPVVCLLPGSRWSEASRLLPVFAETVRRLERERPGLRFVLPAVDALRAPIGDAVRLWPTGSVVVCEESDRFDAFAAAAAALAASGTVALELAMARTPTVICYRMNAVTAWLVRRAIKVPHVNLVNVLLDQTVVPELLQNDCRPDRLAAALTRLLDDPEARSAQTQAAERAIAALGGASPPPSARAAEVVASVIEASRR